jgi:hypothetical protein
MHGSGSTVEAPQGKLGAVGYILFAASRLAVMWIVLGHSYFSTGLAGDAWCNEMVAFLRRTEVICTLNAAVSV